MVIDSPTGVFQVENGLSFALLRDRVGGKVVICVRYLLLMLWDKQCGERDSQKIRGREGLRPEGFCIKKRREHEMNKALFFVLKSVYK